MFYTTLFTIFTIVNCHGHGHSGGHGHSSSHHTSHSVSSMRKTNQIRVIVPKVIISSIVFHRFYDYIYYHNTEKYLIYNITYTEDYEDVDKALYSCIYYEYDNNYKTNETIISVNYIDNKENNNWHKYCILKQSRPLTFIEKIFQYFYITLMVGFLFVCCGCCDCGNHSRMY